MDIGRLGVWANTDGLSAKAAAGLVKRVEGWGYGAFWFAEALGRNAFAHASWLLANTKSLTIATGIANVYARDPVAMKAAQYSLAEQSDGRFLLGMGVSHAPLVAGLRGHAYERPFTKMNDYLAAMARADYLGPAPAVQPKMVIAALGPKMMALSASATDGAHPYNVTVEHTREARSILGQGKLLCPEQMILLETDPGTARGIGRTVLARYLALPNYRNNLKRFGFGDADLDSGSDRLIDALIAWGDEAAIRRRIQEHWDAGADHVCIQAIPRDNGAPGPEEERTLELFAPARG